MWPLINLSALIGGNFFFQKNPLQDLLSSLNAVVSTNERNWILRGHVTFKLCYNQIYQLKITNERLNQKQLWKFFCQMWQKKQLYLKLFGYLVVNQQ